MIFDTNMTGKKLLNYMQYMKFIVWSSLLNCFSVIGLPKILFLKRHSLKAETYTAVLSLVYEYGGVL